MTTALQLLAYQKVLEARAEGRPAPTGKRERPSRAGQWISAYEHAMALRRLAKSWHLGGAGYDPEHRPSREFNPYMVGANRADAAEVLRTLDTLSESVERLINILV